MIWNKFTKETLPTVNRHTAITKTYIDDCDYYEDGADCKVTEFINPLPLLIAIPSDHIPFGISLQPYLKNQPEPYYYMTGFISIILRKNLHTNQVEEYFELRFPYNGTCIDEKDMTLDANIQHCQWAFLSEPEKNFEQEPENPK